MGSPAIPSFDQFKAQQAQPIPSFDEFQQANAASRADAQPHSVASDVGDTLKQYWDKINPVTGAQALAKAAVHPLDTINSYGAQNGKIYQDAKNAFANGDYAQGVRHTLSYFLNGIPGVGALLDEAGNKAGKGDYKGAIADTAALATQIVGAKVGPKLLDAATEPDAAANAVSVVTEPIKNAASAVKDAVTTPGTLRMVKGGAEMIGGGGAALGGHPIVGTTVAARGYQQFMQGMAERRAALAAADVTPEMEGLAQSLAGKDFAKLTAAEQAGIRQVASQIKHGAASAPGVPAPGPDYTPSAGTPELLQKIADEQAAPSTSLKDLVDKELAERRGTPTTPIDSAGQHARLAAMSQAHNPQFEVSGEEVAPAADVIDKLPDARTTPTPEQPAARPVPVVTGKGPAPPAAYLDQETTGLQTQPHVSNSGAVADKIAQYLHDNGIKSADIKKLAKFDPQEHSLFWNNTGLIPGVSKQASYAPSLETQERALFSLQRLENAKKISANLVKEMANRPPSMPVNVAPTAKPSVGSTVTLKDGTTGTISKLNPDGSFDLK